MFKGLMKRLFRLMAKRLTHFPAQTQKPLGQIAHYTTHTISGMCLRRRREHLRALAPIQAYRP